MPRTPTDTLRCRVLGRRCGQSLACKATRASRPLTALPLGRACLHAQRSDDTQRPPIPRGLVQLPRFKAEAPQRIKKERLVVAPCFNFIASIFCHHSPCFNFIAIIKYTKSQNPMQIVQRQTLESQQITRPQTLHVYTLQQTTHALPQQTAPHTYELVRTTTHNAIFQHQCSTQTKLVLRLINKRKHNKPQNKYEMLPLVALTSGEKHVACKLLRTLRLIRRGGRASSRAGAKGSATMHTSQDLTGCKVGVIGALVFEVRSGWRRWRRWRHGGIGGVGIGRLRADLVSRPVGDAGCAC